MLKFLYFHCLIPVIFKTWQETWQDLLIKVVGAFNAVLFINKNRLRLKE